MADIKEVLMILVNAGKTTGKQFSARVLEYNRHRVIYSMAFLIQCVELLPWKRYQSENFHQSGEQWFVLKGLSTVGYDH